MTGVLFLLLASPGDEAAASMLEDKPDQTALTGLLKRCGKDALVTQARPARLKGSGDVGNLPLSNGPGAVTAPGPRFPWPVRMVTGMIKVFPLPASRWSRPATW